MKWLFIVWTVLVSQYATAQEWVGDLDIALKMAEQQDKKVMLYFSVSEACSVCESLEQKVFESELFKNHARTNLILVKPIFNDAEPIETKAEKLLIVEKYNRDGFFPLVVLLDAKARVLGKIGLYNEETPEEYLRALRKLEVK